MDGAVVSGPASGLSDPVVLRLGQRVDLGSGFIVEVAGRSLFSAGAVDPAGHEVGSGFRYWMWDAPCADWQDGASAEMRLIKLEADDSRQGAHTDTKLTALDVRGAVLDAAFDPAASIHAASAAVGTVQVTVDAAANAHACDVEIAPGDADPDTAGHQVDLGAAGTDTAVTVTVTVTAADNSTTEVHTLTIARGAAAKASSLTLTGIEGLGFDPGKRRYDTTPAAGSTSTTVDMTPVGDAVLEGFAVTAGDTEVAAISDDGTVSLTAGKDTLVAVRAATADNESQTVYTVRLRGTQQAQSDQGQGARDDQGQGARDSQGIQGIQRHGALGRSLSASGAVAKSIYAAGGAPAGSWTRDVADPVVPRSAPARTAPAGTEPRLTALDVSPGTFTPTFDAATHAYDVGVTHDTEHITVTPTVSSAADAVIDLSDADPDTVGHQVALNAARPGAKPAQTAILVTVNDGTAIDSYTLTVTRDAPPPRIGTRQDPPPPTCTPAGTDATLTTLTLSAGILIPDFAPAVNAYTAAVPYHTGQVTVAAVPAGPQAPVDIDPTDANTIAGGNQVDLAAAPNAQTNGTTTITATVNCTNAYTITVTRPPATSFQRILGADINLTALGLDWPKGIWSDGTTMWVAEMIYGQAEPRVWAVDLASESIVQERSYFFTSIFDYPASVWSDGEVMWVLHRRYDIEAFDHHTKARLEERDLYIGSAADQGLGDPFGMWSDGETMWIAMNAAGNWNPGPGRIIAVDMQTGERQAHKDIAVPVPPNAGLPASTHIRLNDMWSDGTTIWVAYRQVRIALAFDLSSGGRREHLDFDMLSSSIDLSNFGSGPRGIWSDGGVVWFGIVWGPDGEQLVPFYLPTKAALTSITVDGAQVGGFDAWKTSYGVTKAASATTVTVAANAYHSDASVTILPADADAGTDGHQISLETGENTVTVTAGTYNHTMTYTLTVTREN